MLILIDGHNLIPHVRGLSLRQMDDELGLVTLLQTYARVRRRSVEVFFDGAPPGWAGKRSFGMVKAVFVPLGKTADDAIKGRLKRMVGRSAREVTVISADRQVMKEAHAMGASVVPSPDFARELLSAQEAAPPSGKDAPDTPAMDADELAEWLKLFGGK